MFENLSKYVTPNELNLKKKLNFFSPSLPYHFIELHNLLGSTDFEFDVVGVTESKLNRTKKHLATIDLPNSSIEHCPADGAN